MPLWWRSLFCIAFILRSAWCQVLYKGKSSSSKERQDHTTILYDTLILDPLSTFSTTMKDFIPILALVGSAYAFPAAVMDRMAQIAARDANVTPRMLKARQASAGESSCGPIACTTFNEEEQFVSTTGQYAFVAPDFANGDVRGPCPGLNAAANHGYLPHDGVPSIAQSKSFNASNK